ncbi:hypothetical protein NMY22_g11797 [Coprinellus aureogranulatus]|nr:hypothetical protein NMY22_g11797 [Coprinellus aureogranulatus]
MATLNYDESYWAQYPDIVPGEMTPEARIHLVVSLILYLSISLVDLLEFLFTSRIRRVRDRAGRFMGVYRTGSTPKTRFPAGYIYKLWHC